MSAPRNATQADAATASTPTAEHWDFDEGDLSIYMMDNGGSPVFLFQPHEMCDGNQIPWADIVSRVRIATAAPELLEALKLHDAYLAIPQDRGGMKGPKAAALQAWLDAKDAAIAKATGAA